MNFGSPNTPNCRGFTPEELKRIKFDRIDFSSYTNQLTIDLEEVDEEMLEENILHEIKESQ